MRASSIFAFAMAACASLVAAQDSTTDGTTTMTSTLTQTKTITRCAPEVTNCPHTANITTTETTLKVLYPTFNSTTVTPTGSMSIVVYPTGTSGTPTTFVPVVPTTSESGPSILEVPGASSTSVSASGAGGFFVQRGLLLGIVGAGVALLA